MVSIHMHVHFAEETKQLLAVDPPIASSDSSRSAVPASPGLLGWPPLAAAAADDAVPPVHQNIFRHDTCSALQGITAHDGALQSLTVPIEWCNALAQTLNGPG